MESAEGTEECHKNTVRYALSRPALEALTREPTCWIRYRYNGRRLLEDLLLHTTPRPSFATVRDFRTVPQLPRSKGSIPVSKWH